MTSLELIEAFCDGADSGESELLKIKGDFIVFKGTTLAERYKDKIFVNVTRYGFLSKIKEPQHIVMSSVPKELKMDVNYVPLNMGGTIHELYAGKI